MSGSFFAAAYPSPEAGTTSGGGNNDNADHFSPLAAATFLPSRVVFGHERCLKPPRSRPLSPKRTTNTGPHPPRLHPHAPSPCPHSAPSGRAGGGQGPEFKCRSTGNGRFPRHPSTPSFLRPNRRKRKTNLNSIFPRLTYKKKKFYFHNMNIRAGEKEPRCVHLHCVALCTVF